MDLSILFILFIGIISWIIYQNSRKQEIKQRMKEFGQKIEAFEKTEYHIYINNFNKKYFSIIEPFTDNLIEAFIHDIPPENFKDVDDRATSILKKTATIDFWEDLDKLKNLLENKKFYFDESDLMFLLTLELWNCCTQESKEMLLQSGLDTEKELAKKLLERYGNNWKRYFVGFYETLETKKLAISKLQAVDIMKSCEAEIELSNFEKEMSKETPQSIKDINFMSGHEFEHFLKDLFVKMGYEVETTKLSRDQGADLVIKKFGIKTVVQAKRYSFKVSNSAIQEVVASIKHYNASKGLVVATNQFTKSAIELAKSNNIDLIDRNELNQLISRYL